MDTLSFTWEGFRGFSKPTTFRVPRIALFIGRNNVGKTSAYAPLLMLRQTLDARSSQTALLSRGELIDVGPFRDYVSGHDVQNEITFTIPLPGEPEVRFFPGEKSARLATMDVRFATVDGNTAFLNRHRILSEGKPLVTRSREQPGEPFTVNSRVLPTQISSGRPTKELTALRTGMREEQPEGFFFRGFGGLIIPSGVRQDRDRWAKVQDWYNAAYNLFEVHQDANRAATSLLRGVSYIGPLRSLPSRTYRLAAEPPQDVGRSGENAPEMLFRIQDEEQSHPVEQWMRTLGYGRPRFRSVGDEYFQLLVETDSGDQFNIADSGVGLSQVLPLLVQGAAAKSNDMLIAQQPEIHLNPAQQSIVTDFLISRASDGVRVLIETHSEHVLLRLRRRIAEGEIDSNDVAIYFVDHSAGVTRIQEIPVSESGQIERDNWPKGFFEDQLVDSLKLAQAQMLAATREERNYVEAR